MCLSIKGDAAIFSGRSGSGSGEPSPNLKTGLAATDRLPRFSVGAVVCLANRHLLSLSHYLVATVLLSVVAGQSCAAPVPRPFKVEYVVKHGPLTMARMVREFTVMPTGAYRFTSKTKTAGIAALVRREQIGESSEGTIIANAFSPHRYQYHRSGGKKERRIAVTFDQKAGKIDGLSRGKKWQMAMQPGILDKLLYQLVLMRDIEENQKRDLRYVIVDSGVAKTYLFNFTGEQRIKTPVGTYETYRFRRQKSGSRRKTTLWCAPALGFLPVRLDYQEKDGQVTTVLLDSVNVSPAPPPD